MVHNATACGIKVICERLSRFMLKHKLEYEYEGVCIIKGMCKQTRSVNNRLKQQTRFTLGLMAMMRLVIKTSRHGTIVM